MYYYYDPTYILVLIGVIITLISSARMKTTYNKYAQIPSLSGMTGREVAQRILAANGITEVSVMPVSGNLSDNYNPKTKTVNLSQGIYNGTSLAAISVAAHECGHAIQDYEAYYFLKFRTVFAPIASFGSTLGIPLVFIGIILNGLVDYSYSASGALNLGYILIELGILGFLLAVTFQLVTLPVEFNASHRALNQLTELNFLYDDEEKGAKKVLKAAALTYVAAAAASVLQLLRILLLTGGRRRRS